MDSVHKARKHRFWTCSIKRFVKDRGFELMSRLFSILPNVFVNNRVVKIESFHVDKAFSRRLLNEWNPSFNNWLIKRFWSLVWSHVHFIKLVVPASQVIKSSSCRPFLDCPRNLLPNHEPSFVWIPLLIQEGISILLLSKVNKSLVVPFQSNHKKRRLWFVLNLPT